MTIVDIIVILLIVGALIFGWHKGLVKQVGSVVAIVAALIACRILGPQATTVAAGCLGVSNEGSSLNHYGAMLLGYASVFLIFWFGIWMVSRMLHKTLKAVHLGKVNSLGGSLFMAAKWIFTAGLLLNLWHLVEPDSSIFSGSVARSAMAFVPWVMGAVGAG